MDNNEEKNISWKLQRVLKEPTTSQKSRVINNSKNNVIT